MREFFQKHFKTSYKTFDILYLIDKNTALTKYTLQ